MARHTHQRLFLTSQAIRPFPSLPRVLFPLYAPLKIAWLLLQLLYTLLFAIPRPAYCLVQNPPSVPTLAVAALACRLRRARLVIDWHNFGFTLLRLSLPRALHSLVWLHRQYERLLARAADAHLCVTRAGARFLSAEWGVHDALVIYDRAPAFFRRTPVEAAHELWLGFNEAFADTARALGEARGVPFELSASRSLFTEQSSTRRGSVRLRADRPALVVSSTSWTADEDFGVLLGALHSLDDAAERARRDASASGAALPAVVCIVTGKGPLRAQFEARLAAQPLRHVFVKMLFLPFEQYPVLLGAADVGVCLHTSSSGLDLPMKVVDMFGCGLPVCAIDFACLGELVRDGENGLIFTNADELASCLTRLLTGFPAESALLGRLGAGARTFQSLRWADNWANTALAVFSARQNRH